MSDVKIPKVRFAPSPTGQLHFGSARTALFNYLFAKHYNGQFYLRIEDTDKDRSKQEYVEQICSSLQWLGLDWDGEPFFQSTRLENYQVEIQSLLKNNSAYRCFCSKDVLEAARTSGLFQYSGTCRNLSEEDLKLHLNSGESYVVRLRIPDGETAFDDLIYGFVSVNHEEIDDFIIARSDGHPTYNLTAVVDDHEMEITHVIRGEDHISNTPKQILIYNALGYEIPHFAHLPMILGPDKKRLSKRHGAAGIQEFRDAGYAADALLNYLVMLGWNPGTEQELFTREEMVAQFAIQKVQKKGAVYDEKKLHWIAGQHLARVSEDEILQSIRSEEPNWQRHAKDEYIHHILKLMKIRAKTFNELKDMTGYFFSDPVTFDQEAAAKRWKDKSLNKLIEKYIQRLENIANWSAADLEKVLRATAEDMAVSAAKLIHPVRLAVSGQSEGPGLFELLELLGKMTCIRRLRKALTRFPLTND